MDFHFTNVCPLGDSMKGLDFDTKFMLIIPDADKEMKRHGKIYMLTQFLAYTRLYDNIMFDYDKIQTKLGLNYESIHSMVKYFNNNSILSINPISQLCLYSISNQRIDCDLSSTKKMPSQEYRVKQFVQNLCIHIFNNSLGKKNAKGGKRGTKRKCKWSPTVSPYKQSASPYKQSASPTASPYKQSASPYKQSASPTASPYRKNLFTFKRSRLGLKTSKL